MHGYRYESMDHGCRVKSAQKSSVTLATLVFCFCMSVALLLCLSVSSIRNVCEASHK